MRFDLTDSLRITIDQLRKRMDAGEDFTLLDTRNPQAWAQSDAKLPKALRITLDNFEGHLNELPKDKPVIAYCT